VALMLTLAAVFGLASPAGAGGPPVSGSFMGTGSFELVDLNTFHTWHDITGTWTGLGPVTAHLDYLVTIQGAGPFTGTFTIIAHAGTLTGQLSGHLSGGPVPGTNDFPVRYDLSVTGGTGPYARASGSLTLDAVWNGGAVPVFGIAGTVSGRISLAPARAA
jgi:hypothetical protein